MPLITLEINLILTWASNRVIKNSTGAGTLAIPDTKLYIPVVTISTQDNVKLLDQLKPGLKRSIKCNKYQSNVSIQRQNQYLSLLIDPN